MWVSLSLITMMCWCASVGAEVSLQSSALQTLAFGSCSKPQLVQSHWKHVNDLNPQVFLWLGDIVYADLNHLGQWITDSHRVLKQEYDLQKVQEQYAQYILNNTNITVLGVWDDHDYGKDNMGKHYPHKELSKSRLLEFLDEPQDSPRFKRNGIFVSYEYGSAKENNLVKIILLDGRYFRDDCNNSNPEAQYLGEEQWEWLTAELSQSKARVHLFASGIQFVADDRYQFSREVTGGKKFVESWGAFPYERERMIHLIEKYQVPGVIFLSGDVHFAELSALECSSAGYTIYDLTSSSLTHSWMTLMGYVKLKEHPLVTFANEGHLPVPWLKRKIASCLTYLLYWIAPHRFSEQFYGGSNFGTIEFDWINEQIHLKVHDSFYSGVEIEKVLSLSSLVPSREYTAKCSTAQFEKARLKSSELGQFYWKLRLCIVLLTLSSPFIFVFVKLCFFVIRKFSCMRKKKGTKLE
jgi:alkaline phosphatase D